MGNRVEFQQFEIQNDKGYYKAETPLATAIQTNYLVRAEFTLILLKCGADPNEIVSIENGGLLHSLKSRKTALLRAIELEDITIIRLLLRFGADVNRPAKGRVKRTPLQQAAEQGNLKVFQLLLLSGAKVNDAPAHSGGATALQLAAIGGFVGIVELLWENGADVNAPGAKIHGRTAIEGAAENGRLGVVEFIMQHGARLDTKGGRIECTAIQLAKLNGHSALAECLHSYLDQIHATHFIEKPVEAGPRNAPSEQDDTDELVEEQGDEFSDENQAKNTAGYICQHCRQSLSTSSALARHTRSKHSDVSTHMCNLCLQTFKRKDGLQRHIATHQKTGRVSCPSCGKLFSRKDYLNSVHLASNGQCKKTMVG